MSWGSPNVLFALWLVPCVGSVLFYAHRKRRLAALQFAAPSMAQRLIPGSSPTRLVTRATLLMLATGLLIVAAARPQFGVVVEQVSARGADLFVLLDVSRSMLAEDVAPNRLERAKSDILDLLPRLEGDRIGLIVFAGAPVELVPLTTDQGFFRMALDDVEPGSAPRGGSLIGDAIRRGMESLEERGDRDQVIVLITDGEDHKSFPLEAAKQAGERGIRIISIGLGDTDEGARIPRRNEDGSVAYTQDEGKEVWSKMNESLLKEMATTTSGAWIPARTRAYDLGQIYEDNLAGLVRGEFQSTHRRRFKEQFQVFGIVGLILLMVAQTIPESMMSKA
ncbi:MAG: VWA domain-containing protein [Fuerstiella sp.]|nr:VWA domain-containing protein [Fuerstiella sp.]